MGLRTSHIFMVMPSEQGSRCSIPPGVLSGSQPSSPSRLHQACATCAIPVSFGLDWGLRLVVS